MLQGVLNVWEDLEKSYKEKGKGESRADFLKKIVGVKKDGSNRLDSLKAAIMKEYEGNEAACDDLSTIFDSLKSLDLKEIDDIENLNKFVESTVRRYQKSVSSSVEELPDNFFSGLNPYSSEDLVRVLPFATHLNETKFATDVFSIEGNTPVANILDFRGSDDVVVFKAGNSIPEFLERFKKGGEFVNKCYSLLQKLINDNNMPTYTVFLGSSMFRTREDVVYVGPGGNSIGYDIKERGEISGMSYVKCTASNDYLETPVYCIK